MSMQCCTPPTRQQIQSTIPEALRQLDQWIVWRPGHTDPTTGKFDKIPFDPATRKASSDKDPTTWKPYAVARGASSRIGYCLSEHDGLTLVDLDYCVHKRIITPRALQLMQEIGGYWEFSPSGTGVKGWVYGKLSENITGIHNGISIEIYGRKRFGAMTGQRVSGCAAEPEPAQQVLERLAAQLRPAKTDDTPRVVGPVQPMIHGMADELDARAQTLLAQLRRGHIPPVEFQRLQVELKATNRAFIRAVADGYNTANCIESELERRGCFQTGANARGTYWCSLPGEVHGHKTTLRCFENRVFSLSSHGLVADQPKGLAPFDLVVALDHSGNRVAAARALFGAPTTPAPAQAATQVVSVREREALPNPEQVAVRTADAARKRDARKAEAQAIHEYVLDRARQDQRLTDGHIDTLLDLLTIAESRDWCRPSTAALAERRNVSERTIERRLTKLEGWEYFHTTEYVTKDGKRWRGGKGTAIRTFLRATQEHVLSPDRSDHDHEFGESLVTDKGAASSTPPAQPEPQASLLGVETQQAAPIEAASAVEQTDYEPYTLAYWQQLADAAGGRTSQPKPRGLPTEEARRRFCEHMQFEVDRVERQRLAEQREAIAAANDATEQITLLESVEDVPVEFVQFIPPSDSIGRQRYYSLTGAARKARNRGNTKQAAALESQARRLMERIAPIQQARIVIEDAAPLQVTCFPGAIETPIPVSEGMLSQPHKQPQDSHCLTPGYQIKPSVNVTSDRFMVGLVQAVDEGLRRGKSSLQLLLEQRAAEGSATQTQ